jgi:DHA1 family bicyclomycin/chloramphenicol resistance-like MFS transporter
MSQASPRRLVVVLGALSAFGPLSIDMYLPGLPSMSRDLSASASAAQLTVTACLIGLGVGQLLAGPISDALGRRRPLLLGLLAYMAASLLCALSPSVWVLVALRFVQGLAGAVGIVLARAIVRDRHEGDAAARMYAVLFAINALAPVLAPISGGQLLHVTDWRGIFVVLCGVGAVLLVTTGVVVPETLPVALRRRGGIADTLQVMRGLLGERRFVGYLLCGALAYAALFAYIAGSPFVLQDIHGVSPQVFSLLFGLNAVGILAATQISARLLPRVGSRRLLSVGLHVCALGTAVVFVAVVAGLGLVALLIGLFIAVASVGMVSPNAAALAMSGHPSTGGSASGLVGLTGFALGGAIAPVVGVGGSHDALPMAIVMVAMGLSGLVVLRTLVWRVPSPGGGDEAPPTALVLSELPPTP